MVTIFDKQGRGIDVHDVDARELIATGAYSLAVPTQEEIEASIEHAKADDTAKSNAAKIMTPEKSPADIENPKRAYNKKG